MEQYHKYRWVVELDACRSVVQICSVATGFFDVAAVRDDLFDCYYCLRHEFRFCTECRFTPEAYQLFLRMVAHNQFQAGEVWLEFNTLNIEDDQKRESQVVVAENLVKLKAAWEQNSSIKKMFFEGKELLKQKPRRAAVLTLFFHPDFGKQEMFDPFLARRVLNYIDAQFPRVKLNLDEVQRKEEAAAKRYWRYPRPNPKRAIGGKIKYRNEIGVTMSEEEAAARGPDSDSDTSSGTVETVGHTFKRTKTARESLKE
jgi:hypothetical protein